MKSKALWITVALLALLVASGANAQTTQTMQTESSDWLYSVNGGTKWHFVTDEIRQQFPPGYFELQQQAEMPPAPPLRLMLGLTFAEERFIEAVEQGRPVNELLKWVYLCDLAGDERLYLMAKDKGSLYLPKPAWERFQRDYHMTINSDIAEAAPVEYPIMLEEGGAVYYLDGADMLAIFERWFVR